MKVIFISPIFCPNDNMFTKNMNSLESAIKYVLPNVKMFVIGGYCAKEEYWTEIYNLQKNSNNKIFKIYKGCINMGKAFYVNKMINYLIKQNYDFDYILTCDSDIIFINDIIHKFKNLKLNNHGIIAANQLENCCHVINKLDIKKVKYDDKVIIFYYSYAGEYIAGGCWFILKNAWIEVDGYRILGVYCSDDMHLLKDIFNKNYKVCICDELTVIHPNEENLSYSKWKRNTSNKKMNLIDAVKDSENFWNNK